jgi:hypothetical protein
MLFPSTSVKNIATVKNKPEIYPIIRPQQTSRNPNKIHLTKTEEPKINIDRRYNNLLFNLLPKPLKRKVPNLSEYQDKYIPHDVDYVRPIYKKAPGLKAEIKPTKIGFINPDDTKKQIKKRKPDNIDNYKIPEKLKKEIKALDDIDNYNIGTHPFSKVPKGKKIPDDDLSHSRNPGGRKSPEITARNPNARARSSEPKIIRIPKNINPVKSPSGVRLPIQQYKSKNPRGDEEDSPSQKNPGGLSNFSHQSNPKGNLFDNDYGLEGGDNPIAGEDKNKIKAKNPKGNLMTKKEANKKRTSKELGSGKSPSGIQDDKNKRGLEGGDNPFAGDDKNGQMAKNPKGKPITREEAEKMKSPNGKPLFSGKAPNGIADIERGLEGGDNPIAGDDKNGVKANNPKGKPITRKEAKMKNPKGNEIKEGASNPKGISDNMRGLDGGDNPIAGDNKNNKPAKNSKGKPQTKKDYGKPVKGKDGKLGKPYDKIYAGKKTSRRNR